MSCIEIKDLSFKYNGHDVLKNINLFVQPGKFTGIIGPNGCGKTTLMKNISNQLNILNQKVFINDLDIKKMNTREIAKKIALVNQNNYIEFEFTALEIVLMGRIAHLGRFQKESKKDIDFALECMKKTNTIEFKDKSIRKLSGGELQRVIIARSLCQDTEIILLDEPVSQLDIHHQLEVMTCIKQLCLEENKTIVMVLHDLNLASQFSDIIILMKNGEIFKSGAPNEVVNKYNIEYVYDVKPEIIQNPITKKPFIIYYDN